MDFKNVLLCFALLIVTASVISGSAEKRTLPSYPLKVSKNGKDFDEQVSVDLQRKTETFHLRDASTGKDAGDIVYDFKRGLTMIRLPEEKACFLSKSVTNTSSPAALLQLLKLMNGNADVKITPQSEETLNVVGTFGDRSTLSDEMVTLCAKLPIYLVRKGDVSQNNMGQTADDIEDSDLGQLPAKRTKRECRTVCGVKCEWVCSSDGCHTVCGVKCELQCSWG